MKKILGALVLSAVCGSAFAELIVEGAHIRESIPGAPNSAAFMILKNVSEQDVVLTSVTSELARTTELHNHINDEGVMRMREVPEIVVPSGQSVELKPGGLHVMFMGLATPLKQGEQGSFTLVDQSGREYPVQAPVKKIKMQMKHDHNEGHKVEHKH
jgi:copper(I)-binding protein